MNKTISNTHVRYLYKLSTQVFFYILICNFNIFSNDNSEEPVLTIAIPRPKSSVSVAELAAKSQFPVCITPPPTPIAPSHQSHAMKYGGFSQQQVPVNITQSEEQEVISTTLKRAQSCDSVCSDSSVALGDLEEPNVTGYLCLGLEYDR